MRSAVPCLLAPLRPAALPLAGPYPDLSDPAVRALPIDGLALAWAVIAATRAPQSPSSVPAAASAAIAQAQPD